MARYKIVDMEKWEANLKDGLLMAHLETSDVFLSPEETEAKWKEVFNAGNRDGWDEPFPATPYDQKWEELKKTL